MKSDGNRLFRFTATCEAFHSDQCGSMKTIKRTTATIELLLIAPATLFMAALFVRNVQPQQYEPAHTAQRIVDWYAARPQSLTVLLFALPLTALITGGWLLYRRWHDDAELRRAAMEMLSAVRTHVSTLLVTAATVAAAVILSIVALHVATD